MRRQTPAPFGTRTAQDDEPPVSREAPNLDAAQDALVRDLTALVGKAVGLDAIPCHGMWLRAVRTWQDKHGKSVCTLSERRPDHRARAAAEIRDQFVELAQEVLRTPEQRQALAVVIRDAFAMYLEKYNKRPPA